MGLKDGREHPEDMVREVDEFCELICQVIICLKEGWKRGEGDLMVEIRDDLGITRGKITASKVYRIGHPK